MRRIKGPGLTLGFKKEIMNLWNHLEKQTLKDKIQIEQHLLKKLGKPNNELNNNLFQEIVKKINSYYSEPESQNHTTYSLFGYLTEISPRKYKEGKNKGQTYYVLKLGGAGKEILQARKENLSADQWQQIEKMALLGKNLVFKYKKWFANKQVLDFYPQSKK